MEKKQSAILKITKNKSNNLLQLVIEESGTLIFSFLDEQDLQNLKRCKNKFLLFKNKNSAKDFLHSHINYGIMENYYENITN